MTTKGTNVVFLSLCVVTVSILLVIAKDDPELAPWDKILSCEVSEWSEWSECIRSPACPRSGGASAHAHGHHREATAGYDVGRTRMRQNVKTKTSIWRNRESCTNSHSCPENDQHDTQGYRACTNGLSDIYPCRNIDLMSFLNFEDLTEGMQLKWSNKQFGSDLWGWTDPEDGQEYVLMGTTHGTSFVRITDPENPVVLGFLQTRTFWSIWRDIKVVGNHAYIGSEGFYHGIQIFDLTQLRNIDSFRELNSDVDYLEVGNTHNVVANNDTNMIYLVGATGWPSKEECKGGLQMFNVSEPKEPKYVGCYGDDGYTHDAQCVVYKGPDESYYNHEICFNYNEDTLTIVDVTDKDNPIFISKLWYDGAQYTHQGWLTENHRYILMDDELDEYRTSDSNKEHTRTLVWDVSKLSDPELKTEFWSHEKAIDHNQYIVGNLSYQSNYEAGLRIIHFDQTNWDMKEVAYFDVFPSRTTASFGGTWSNYPYFKSGMVAVSSVEFGLFILKPDMYTINNAIASPTTYGRAYGEQQRWRQIEKAEDGSKCPHPMETRPCVPKSC